MLLGSGAALAPLVFAEEAPRRALQAVTIDLASDGAVTELTSALVSREEGGENPTTRTTALDPSEHAAELPVRVTTSWRHDGQVGTDLADVEGVDGLVEISVTVQNMTGRAERFQYDANGVARQGYELVTTPMTVVASAVMPEDSAATLVRPQAAAAEPGTTNGVITTEEDATTVQWASILAPPRLQPSTTFTLVQDAQDFELPAINLAVQPGVTTDDSVARLVGDVFGGSARMVGSENHTIGLIANVNATLAQVTDSLQTVRETLAVNAGQVGSAATSALRSTADSVDAAAQAVLRDLESLRSSVGTTVESTNGSALGALDESVQGVLDFFGTPAPLSGAAPVTACGDQAAAQPPATTLLGQLDTVSRQLRQLADASGNCVADLTTSLQDTIGVSTDCPAGSEALVCRLVGASGSLQEVAEKVRTDGGAIAGTLDLTTIDGVKGWITGLEADVKGLQDAAAAVQQAGASTPPPLAGLLGTLNSSLTDALSTFDVTAAGPRKELAELRTAIEGAFTGAASPARLKLDGLATRICDLPVDPADTTLLAEQAALRAAIDGQTCGVPFDEDAVGDSLLGELIDEKTAVLAALGEVETQLGAVRTSLAGIRQTASTLPTDVESAVDSELDAAVTTLQQQLGALYDPTGDVDAPLNQLRTTFATLENNRAGVATQLGTLLDGAADQVDDGQDEGDTGNTLDAQDVVDAAKGRAEGARDQATTGLGTLSQEMTDSLTGSAEQQLAQGRAVVGAQTARLAAVEAAAAQELDAAAQEAVGRLAEQISLANQSQSAASAALQEQLQKVLLDLGSASDGRGLLGVIQNSAGQTGVRTEQVAQTSQSAASFRGVRQVEVADAQLEQQQFARSLQAAQRFEPFAEELPAGSVSATVFCFRIGQEG